MPLPENNRAAVSGHDAAGGHRALKPIYIRSAFLPENPALAPYANRPRYWTLAAHGHEDYVEGLRVGANLRTLIHPHENCRHLKVVGRAYKGAASHMGTIQRKQSS
jgi:hypothetical protein